MAKGKDEKHNPNRKVGREHLSAQARLSAQMATWKKRTDLNSWGNEDPEAFLDKHAYDDRDLDD
jgi:hypothetical protein